MWTLAGDKIRRSDLSVQPKQGHVLTRFEIELDPARKQWSKQRVASCATADDINIGLCHDSRVPRILSQCLQHHQTDLRDALRPDGK